VSDIFVKNKEDGVYYIILLITTIFIFISIILYNVALNGLQTAFILGERMQNECQNVYTIYNTSNHQLSLVIKDPNGPDKIINIADLILYFVIFLLCVSVIFEHAFLYLYKKSDVPGIKDKINFGAFVATPVVAFCVLIPILIAKMDNIRQNIGKPSYLDTNTDITYTFYTFYALFVVVFCADYYLNQFSRTDGTVIIKPYTVILVAISFVAVVLLSLIQNNKLFNSINTSYKNRTDNGDIQTTIAYYVKQIYKKDAQLNGVYVTDKTEFKTYADLQSVLTNNSTPFARYLMENIKAVPKWNNTTPPDDTPLWPFVINDANGMELDNFYSYDEAKTTSAALTTGTVGSTDKDALAQTQNENIKALRSKLRELRNFNEPSTQLSELSANINLLIFIILILVVYPLFNIMYKTDRILVTYISTIGLIIILSIFCAVSFVSKLL
jgi:hypothetical protein